MSEVEPSVQHSYAWGRRADIGVEPLTSKIQNITHTDIKVMVNFNVVGKEMPGLDFSRIESWIETVAALHGFETGRVSYLFCDDEYILKANRDFIGHDYYTDIITFDYTHRNRIGGDIMISLDTVASNADKFGISVERELLRVIIHGILHLCGIDDKGPGEREIMEAHENDALSWWDSMPEGK